MTTIRKIIERTAARAEPEQARFPLPAGHRNVSEDERLASLAAGAALAAVGLARRSVPGMMLAAVGGALAYRGATGFCPVSEQFGIDTASSQRAVRISQAFTIDKSAEELYRFWRHVENLREALPDLEAVEQEDDQHSRWRERVSTLLGGTYRWRAEITEDVPNERIAWRTVEPSDCEHQGCVTFEGSGRGTVVRVDLRYIPPGGYLGQWAAKLSGQDPSQQLRKGLRHLKRTMEIGEELTTEGQSRGTCKTAVSRFMR